jgi:hypothetical protein
MWQQEVELGLEFKELQAMKFEALSFHLSDSAATKLLAVLSVREVQIMKMTY